LADARRRWYVQCPNPSKDSTNHYLPATLADYADPLVVALVGRPRSGKTHLVVAMIRELLGGASAGEHGLRAEALDFYQHVTFKRNYLDPFERGSRLPGTRVESGTYLEWLVVQHGGVKRPLVFFDVAGEDFRNPAENARYTRFLVNAGALLFVEDAPWIFRHLAEEQDLRLDETLKLPPGASNEWVQEAVSRLPPGRRDLPAVVALTKSDRLRYHTPADRWLREHDGGQLSPERMLAETRDVYALLHSARANSVMIRLYGEFDRCTMHFVSATGGAVAENDTFPVGVRPQRVLVPLLALFAMVGLIPGPNADRVGR
ncbi:TRAFAC clade GTPase domain-containing protein, partial [Actinophytocola sp.]|uniref:TRAFAC clade GTPase domain-containing protein n=1 Tax=Actinophytocola sp. TaxID=1872138 RepID=UPI003899F124